MVGTAQERLCPPYDSTSSDFSELAQEGSALDAPQHQQRRGGEVGEIEAPVFPVFALAVQQIVLARIHGQSRKIGIEFEVERIVKIPRHAQAVLDHRPVQQVFEVKRDVFRLEI